MQDQHGIAYLSVRTFLRCAQSVIVQLDLRKFFSGLELKALDYKGAGLRRGIVSGVNSSTHQHSESNDSKTARLHETLLGCEGMRRKSLNSADYESNRSDISFLSRRT